MSRWSRYLGFAVTLVFVALLLWKIDLGELSQAFRSANYLWLTPAILTTLLSYGMRTRRWGFILRPIKRVPFGTLLPVLFIGFMANNLLPARIGELVRAYTLGRKTGLSKSMGLATILLERLFDGITLVVVLGVLAMFFPLPPREREVGYVAGGIFLVAAAAAVIVLSRESLALRLLELGLGWLPRRFRAPLRGRVRSFLLGLRVLHSRRDMLAIAAWSAAIWSVEAITYVVVPRSVHAPLPAGASLQAALLMMVMVNLGSLIPSTPGYIGTFQVFGVLALSAFGVPTAIALAAAILAHVVQYVLVTSVGLVFLARESVGWSAFAHAGETDAVDFGSSAGAGGSEDRFGAFDPVE